VLNNGIVVMRNVIVDTGREVDTDYRKMKVLNDATLIMGENIHLRIDNCTVKNESAILVSGNNSSSYITNSTFINSQISITGNAAWIENCTIMKSIDMPSAKTVVVKKCKISRVVISNKYKGSKIFFLENEYIKLGEIDGIMRIFDDVHDIDRNIYIYNAQIAELLISSGSINIYDTTIDNLRLDPILDEVSTNRGVPIANLNLLNVKIGRGNWYAGQLRQGKWEHVQLGAPINLDRAKIGTITGHYVEFTNGYPWVNGKLDIVDSSKPLKFDKPPVPTLEELGLAQFWKENDFPHEDY
jgi:hypothetical protein